jgi:diguanylate cyclase (GGDEF)-like protein
MDPVTVILLLSMNLLAGSGLLFLIGRRLPSGSGGSGLGAFAAGSGLFGLAYVGRLVDGVGVTAPTSALWDGAMVFSVLMFANGLRLFTQHRAWPPARLAALTAGFTAFDLAFILAGDALARHLLLNLTLALGYGVLAAVAARESRRSGEALRLPLRGLALMTGVLGLMTGLRAASLLRHGLESLFAGTLSQIYYAYAALSALLLCPFLLWMVFLRLNGQLAELASRDALTHVLNRHGLDDMLRRHFGLRLQEPLCLLQVDIDHFKRINDERGHAAGDAMLRAVALALQMEVRAGDFVARTGGEEFLIGCLGASQSVALSLGERLRRAVATLRVPAPDGGEPLRCTVSVGVSRPFAGPEAWQEATREADAALYRAKADGRDRVLGSA